MFRASNTRVRGFHDSSGMSLSEFKATKKLQISEISKLLRCGSYTFSPLTPVFIPKPEGTERLICIPLIRDRLVQRAMYRFLSNGQYSFDNPVSYGFIRGKSAKDALKASVKKRHDNPWVYKADISSFFDKIPREVLKEQLRMKLRVSSLFPLLDAVIDTEVNQSVFEDRKKIRAMGIRNGVGLRQGMPLSPYLANLLLWDFDSELLSTGFEIIRYADDIIAFAKTEEDCKLIHDTCADLLASVKLKIHALGDGSKTKIYTPEQTAEFLGQGISRRKKNKKYCLTVTTPQANKIKEKLLAYKDFDNLLRRGITYPRFLSRIESTVQSYILTYSECENVEKLSQMMKDTRDSVVSYVLNKTGIDITRLNKKQLAFLEL